MKTLTRRNLVTGKELRVVQSHLIDQGTYFIASSNSLYVPKGKEKYIDESVVQPWPDIEGQIRQMQPGEAARTELLREWPHLKRVGWSPAHIKLLDWRSPLHYSGPHVGHMTYIDLDAAYSQVYEKLWLDTSFPRSYYGRFPLADVAKRLEVWKAARNSLVGLTRSRQAVAYKNGKRITINMKNKYLSPGLWATVQSVLHMVASKAIELNALYVNTDGYIFGDNTDEFRDIFLTWLSENGFRWSIRNSGLGEIQSWNNYRVGTARTQSNKLNLKSSSRSFSNVHTSDQEKWLKYWRGVQRVSASRNETGDTGR